jgi:hypothetical protein
MGRSPTGSRRTDPSTVNLILAIFGIARKLNTLCPNVASRPLDSRGYRRCICRGAGQKLADVYFDSPLAADKPLTRDEARRLAANVVKLAELLKKGADSYETLLA